jgi:hypothetical protein
LIPTARKKKRQKLNSKKLQRFSAMPTTSAVTKQMVKVNRRKVHHHVKEAEVKDLAGQFQVATDREVAAEADREITTVMIDRDQKNVKKRQFQKQESMLKFRESRRTSAKIFIS